MGPDSQLATAKSYSAVWENASAANCARVSSDSDPALACISSRMAGYRAGFTTTATLV